MAVDFLLFRIKITMKKLFVTMAAIIGLFTMQRAQARGEWGMGCGASLALLGGIFVIAGLDSEEGDVYITRDENGAVKSATSASSLETVGYVFLAGGGVVLLGSFIYWATDGSSTASLRIPIGNKRYALLNGSPVVTPRFQGVGISIKF
jgi:hypothetical protein